MSKVKLESLVKPDKPRLTFHKWFPSPQSVGALYACAESAVHYAELVDLFSFFLAGSLSSITSIVPNVIEILVEAAMSDTVGIIHPPPELRGK